MGSANANMNANSNCFTRLRSYDVLVRAWRHVSSSGRLSTSPETRAEVDEFYAHEHRNIRTIQTQLRQEKFVFLPARGVAKHRIGKAPRPVVVAPIRNRMVQRAVLDVLQRVPTIRSTYLDVPTSFGGIKGHSVKDALIAATEAVSAGARYYVCSDIADFFRGIPRQTVVATLMEHVQDERFGRVLDAATETELNNRAALGDDAKLFPSEEIGVPQGCSLSSLLGNVLLLGFDRQLNGSGITCLRYVDDFILLGPNVTSVRKAFQSGMKLLSDLERRTG